MFSFTECIEIDASRGAVWDVMRDVRDWWPPSNPEHDSLEVLDGKDQVALGTKLRIRERVAGIPGDAVGTITEFEPGHSVAWEAPEAHYRLAGARITVAEGVTWHLKAGREATQVSAHVWARFPSGWMGRALEWAFMHMGGSGKGPRTRPPGARLSKESP